MSVVVWLRQDLRLHKHPAFAACAGETVVPVYIWAPEEEGEWALGEGACRWLYAALKQLQQELRALGGKLVLCRGPSAKTLAQLCRTVGAQKVVWSRRYEPASMQRDRLVEEHLRQRGIAVETFNSALLVEPWEITTQAGRPFQQFTAFCRCHAKHYAPPVFSSYSIRCTSTKISSLTLDALGLPQAPLVPWEVGELGAHNVLKHFLKKGLEGYAHARDFPAEEGVSHLSPYLHFGHIHPGEVWAACISNDSFIRQLVWRDFAHHLLYHFPHTPTLPLRAAFANFPWAGKAQQLQRWKEGNTGYPLVDAGMRQLLKSGWMHNRVRMVVASFLTKHLLLPWQEGAHWFWEHLVDADLANNTFGWQWCSGCGADAAPYFRIFNPTLQAQRFDPEGAYVRQFVPELTQLPSKWIHTPWKAPEAVLESCGVILGKTYPRPIVDHVQARKRALLLYHQYVHFNKRFESTTPP